MLTSIASESTLLGKTIVLGVTGSIAAWKACEIVTELVRLGFNVYVIMTKAATKFITPLTMSTLSRNPVFTDMFKGLQHTNLASSADMLLIAPATANIIGKMANGIADDLLTTTALASRAPKLIAPAMNPNMYANSVVKANILKLKEIGVKFVEPEYGKSVCGDLGVGLLAATGRIIGKVIEILEEMGEEKETPSEAQKANTRLEPPLSQPSPLPPWSAP